MSKHCRKDKRGGGVLDSSFDKDPFFFFFVSFVDFLFQGQLFLFCTDTTTLSFYCVVCGGGVLFGLLRDWGRHIPVLFFFLFLFVFSFYRFIIAVVLGTFL